MPLAQRGTPQRQHGSPSPRRKSPKDAREATTQRRAYGTVPFAAVASPTAQRRLDVAARCPPSAEASETDAEVHGRAPAGPAQAHLSLANPCAAAAPGALHMAVPAVPAAIADLAAAVRKPLHTSAAGDGTQNRSAIAASAHQHAAPGPKAAAFLDDRQWRSALGSQRQHSSKASARSAPAVLPVPSTARRAAQPAVLSAHGSAEHRCSSSSISDC